MLNMFRTLICPSSGVCDYVIELPNWLISFLVCCVLELGCGSARVVSGMPAEGANVSEENSASFFRFEGVLRMGSDCVGRFHIR